MSIVPLARVRDAVGVVGVVSPWVENPMIVPADEVKSVEYDK